MLTLLIGMSTASGSVRITFPKCGSVVPCVVYFGAHSIPSSSSGDIYCATLLYRSFGSRYICSAVSSIPHSFPQRLISPSTIISVKSYSKMRCYLLFSVLGSDLIIFCMYNINSQYPILHRKLTHFVKSD